MAELETFPSTALGIVLVDEGVDELQRLRADVERLRASEERHRLLAEVAAGLTLPLEEPAVAREIAVLVGSRLADWCFLDTVDEQGRMHRTCVSAAPEGREIAARYERMPLSERAPMWRTLQTGQPQLLRITDELIESSTFDDTAAHVLREMGLRSVLIVPLVARGRTVGALSLAYGRSGREYGDDDLTLASEIAHRAALALDNVRLLDRERRARHEAETAQAHADALFRVAERNADRTRRLQRVTAELSRSLVPTDIAQVVIAEGTEGLDAHSAALWQIDEERGELALLRAHNYDDAALAIASSVPLDADIPVAAAVIRGDSIWLESRRGYAEQFPISEARTRSIDPTDRALACLPVGIEGRTLGALAFAFEPGRSFDPDERAFLRAIADQCAQALDRARSYHRAVEAVRVRDDFLSIAGHELKTPLTALILQVQSLLRHADPADVRLAERTNKLLRLGERMTTLIDELLDVSRISGGRLRLEREDVDIVTLVQEVAGRLAEELTRGGSDLQLDLPPTLTGSWDRVRIEQVVTNLLANAIKYGRGRPISIAVIERGQRVQLRVRDRGIGVPQHDQARIFDRFERAVSSRHFGGLGLGLWIVRQIVEAHGGSIRVQSEAGQGAEFTVELPLRAQEVPV